jgi:hypothetical protein
MPGHKGMTSALPRKSALRCKIWQSMRILRRFTIADLCRTTGAKRSNVRKFVKRLEAHGYLAQQGGFVPGRVGVFRGLRLIKDVGPQHPLRCGICGRPLCEPCLTEQKETFHENTDLD